MVKRYRVSLTGEEQEELKALVSKGRAAAYKQTHARILLLSDENQAQGPMMYQEIPQEWGNMSSLRAFKINGNSITGCLPAKWIGQVDPNYGSTNVAGLPFCN